MLLDNIIYYCCELETNCNNYWPFKRYFNIDSILTDHSHINQLTYKLVQCKKASGGEEGRGGGRTKTSMIGKQIENSNKRMRKKGRYVGFQFFCFPTQTFATFCGTDCTWPNGNSKTLYWPRITRSRWRDWPCRSTRSAAKPIPRVGGWRRSATDFATNWKHRTGIRIMRVGWKRYWTSSVWCAPSARTRCRTSAPVPRYKTWFD